MNRIIPTALNVHKVSKALSLQYGSGESYRLKAEYLRVLSPSAEVRGHGSPVLQIGKLNVGIIEAEVIGSYAIKLSFDDGHDSGIYSWDYLYDLCLNQDLHWASYTQKMHEAGASRDPAISIVRLF
ncbi:MAG: DUF971 domain-containing protein [Candidatus Endonucleobacter bathymodioli]|uniref:DUF971 domain-containing protein n=1 Tax=Candidatus Endonucleibacter bathymodioli TaxID=539814 RepID=A0AA90SSA5_9GAMM|nr:DUF971 domain-containing protein [Candidatus Endonucleobacter bathymodioli]